MKIARLISLPVRKSASGGCKTQNQAGRELLKFLGYLDAAKKGKNSLNDWKKKCTLCFDMKIVNLISLPVRKSTSGVCKIR